MGLAQITILILALTGFSGVAQAQGKMFVKRKILTVSFDQQKPPEPKPDRAPSSVDSSYYSDPDVIVMDGSWKLSRKPKGLYPSTNLEPID